MCSSVCNAEDTLHGNFVDTPKGFGLWFSSFTGKWNGAKVVDYMDRRIPRSGPVAYLTGGTPSHRSRHVRNSPRGTPPMFRRLRVSNRGYGANGTLAMLIRNCFPELTERPVVWAYGVRWVYTPATSNRKSQLERTLGVHPLLNPTSAWKVTMAFYFPYFLDHTFTLYDRSTEGTWHFVLWIFSVTVRARARATAPFLSPPLTHSHVSRCSFQELHNNISACWMTRQLELIMMELLLLYVYPTLLSYHSIRVYYTLEYALCRYIFAMRVRIFKFLLLLIYQGCNSTKTYVALKSFFSSAVRH